MAKQEFIFEVKDHSGSGRYKHYQATCVYPHGHVISIIWGCGTHSYPKCCTYNTEDSCTCNENFERYELLEVAVFNDDHEFIKFADGKRVNSLTRSEIMELQARVSELDSAIS